MQLHTLQPNTPLKASRRVGRGGNHGKTSGRGHKGQKARSSGAGRPEIRDMIKKIPKLRGYNFNSHVIKPEVVSLARIDAVFDAKEIVSNKTLLAKNLVRRQKGRAPKVKILGNGDLTKALVFEGVITSASAREKIESAGGSIS